ncbi:energy transducer TonB [Brevundimonas subvibrioides]|uniref:TonB domain protein n=1 Tax=Brevundimonas subvibrioides (strain ATCC 15264 / DSM 4735 / LMG 14903 / NBRC 16000 / CB 81) TaxID=633149 RepID=D9QGM4_BRESC|nr:energy transducer TonB [Brevundimonas subvibrioides]ADL00840.1 TonB domain protein [Brevundimonas subvibrioides ATCC 15264]
MIIPATPKSARRWRQGGIVLGVVALHAGLFALSGLGHVPPPVVIQTPINVQLVELTPPPPPPPPPEPPAPDAGGGAPAAPSVVRVTPRPVPQPELPAPPRPAPAPALIVGASDQPGTVPGFGQGGQGNGTGDGEGEGDGPGSGSGPIILRGASNGEILGMVPPEARRRRVAGRASVNCVIRPDTRLEGCRVVSESPQGLGFGDAATRVAETYFRFRPPTTASGRSVEGFRATVVVLFGRQ